MRVEMQQKKFMVCFDYFDYPTVFCWNAYCGSSFGSSNNKTFIKIKPWTKKSCWMKPEQGCNTESIIVNACWFNIMTKRNNLKNVTGVSNTRAVVALLCGTARSNKEAWNVKEKLPFFISHWCNITTSRHLYTKTFFLRNNKAHKTQNKKKGKTIKKLPALLAPY